MDCSDDADKVRVRPGDGELSFELVSKYEATLAAAARRGSCLNCRAGSWVGTGGGALASTAFLPRLGSETMRRTGAGVGRVVDKTGWEVTRCRLASLLRLFWNCQESAMHFLPPCHTEGRVSGIKSGQKAAEVAGQ